MPQLYPQPVSANIGVTIQTANGMTGGGTVPLDGTLTLGGAGNRTAYPLTPVPDGVNGTFTLQGPVPPAYADLFVGGKLQATANYAIVGTQVQFQAPPAAGAALYLVFAPNDGRKQYTLTAASSTTYTFPGGQPNAAYVDIYAADGTLLTASTPTAANAYTLSCLAGVWSVVFPSAPAAAPLAVLTPDTYSDRNQFALTQVTSTRYRITGGIPPGPYADIFDNGNFVDPATVTVDLVSGEWVVDFNTAPVSTNTLLAIFSGGVVSASGAAAVVKGRVVLVGGVATVSAPAVTADSDIFLTYYSPGAVVGTLTVSSVTPGTGFAIASTEPSDSSTVTWALF